MTGETITIFGTSGARLGDSAYMLAYQTGKLLAQAGFVIANGGYGGTMEAAAKGAAEAGGKIIGVTCSAFKSVANEFISREIVSLAEQEHCWSWQRSGNLRTKAFSKYVNRLYWWGIFGSLWLI